MPNTDACRRLSIQYRLRWPAYSVEGAGKIVVVLHCCRKVILVGHALEGRLIKGEKCGPYCRIANDQRWHVGYALKG